MVKVLKHLSAMIKMKKVLFDKLIVDINYDITDVDVDSGMSLNKSSKTNYKSRRCGRVATGLGKSGAWEHHPGCVVLGMHGS